MPAAGAPAGMLVAAYLHLRRRPSPSPERTHSLAANFTVDPTGASPVYVTVGTGGATYHNESMRPDVAYISASDLSQWGFALVESVNRSALRVTFRTNVNGGRVDDEAWILRPERAS